MESIHPTDGNEIFGKAIYAMMGNDGHATNADVFFGTVDRLSGVRREDFLAVMDKFYAGEFKCIRASASAEPRVPQMIDTLKRKGYRLILSTQPIFPSAATNQRVQWAGLSPDDFEYISYYDNSSFCKPQHDYFREILQKRGLEADECYIVGNDVKEDMAAVSLGFTGFLLTDHLIGDLEQAPPCQKGDYSALAAFAENLPPI
jgi:FMN phosphatase YigB (HAD superfamily)